MQYANQSMFLVHSVTIKLPGIAKSGAYHVVARAKNNVFAQSSSCDMLDYIEVKETILASSQVPFNPNLLINRWKLSRVAQNQRNSKMGIYIYVAKLKGNFEAMNIVVYVVNICDFLQTTRMAL